MRSAGGGVGAIDDLPCRRLCMLNNDCRDRVRSPMGALIMQTRRGGGSNSSGGVANLALIVRGGLLVRGPRIIKGPGVITYNTLL